MDSVFFYRNPDTDATRKDGLLKGLSIAIQPNMSVAGWPSEAGSNALSGFRAVEDATVVKRLRDAGAVICGSTYMSEFGFGLENSMAGSALKENLADAEMVIDLAGESRLAALRANVCGFKPSYGMVSRYGLIGLIPSMECCGILSGSLETIDSIIKAIAGPDELDFSLPDEKTPDFSPQKIEPEKVTIGVVGDAASGLAAGQEEDFRKAVEELKTAGFILKELSLPDFPLFPLVHRIVGSVEASSCAGRYDSVRYGRRAPGARNWNEMYLNSRSLAFGLLLKGYLFQGAYYQFERYDAFEDACRIRARLLSEMQQLTGQADFLVFPSFDGAPSAAPASLEETYAQFASTIFANVTGQPVLCLPPARGPGHAGFQLSGSRLCDAGLLALGRHLLKLRRGGN